MITDSPAISSTGTKCGASNWRDREASARMMSVAAAALARDALGGHDRVAQLGDELLLERLRDHGREVEVVARALGLDPAARNFTA